MRLWVFGYFSVALFPAKHIDCFALFRLSFILFCLMSTSGIHNCAWASIDLSSSYPLLLTQFLYLLACWLTLFVLTLPLSSSNVPQPFVDNGVAVDAAGAAAAPFQSGPYMYGKCIRLHFYGLTCFFFEHLCIEMRNVVTCRIITSGMDNTACKSGKMKWHLPTEWWNQI